MSIPSTLSLGMSGGSVVFRQSIIFLNIPSSNASKNSPSITYTSGLLN
jgi:hypothetical protein